MTTVSVLVAVYRAQATLDRSLRCLTGQTFADYEVVVVDSSPDGACRRIVVRSYPQVVYRHHPQRLGAHEAHNRAAALAGGDLLAFTDPDAYAEPGWLETLVASHRRSGEPVAGGVACYGRDWLDLGAHLCKFDKWLAGGRSGEVEEAATVNFLVSRRQFAEAGPLEPWAAHADTEFCRRLRAAGHRIVFQPDAVVVHHHRHSWASLLAERFERGRSFAAVWEAGRRRDRAALVRRAAVSWIPLRLLNQTLRVWRHAREAGMGGDFLRVGPVVFSGLYAWLLGEGAGYLRMARRRS